MSAQLFHIGQAVTPISNPVKWSTMSNNVIIKPKFGEIYHVSFYNYWRGYWWVALRELPQENLFLQEGFAPVIGDDELSEALKEVTEEVCV